VRAISSDLEAWSWSLSIGFIVCLSVAGGVVVKHKPRVHQARALAYRRRSGHVVGAFLSIAD
jgi:hypothetical protein